MTRPRAVVARYPARVLCVFEDGSTVVELERGIRWCIEHHLVPCEHSERVREMLLDDEKRYAGQVGAILGVGSSPAPVSPS